MIFKREKEDFSNDYRVVNYMRGLALDAINNANSGHPGICLDAACILYTLYSRHMSIDLNNDQWYNRDRFVLSAGHAAPLFYAMLYMLDIISIDDMKKLRCLGSITPGHPEITTPFVDMATGPLGQGVASAVGMAMAEEYLNATYHKSLINHYTYVLCGDGDLMEGVSYEALSLAGRLKLKKLIILYDSNDITLDGKLLDTSNEDVITRFKALNYSIYVVDGENIKELDDAIKKAKENEYPSIIICKTVIGKYSSKEGSHLIHGKPLDSDEIGKIKDKLEIINSPFTVSSDAMSYFKKKIIDRMHLPLRDWQRKLDNLKEEEKKKLDQLFMLFNPYKLGNIDFIYDKLSLRDISSNILNAIAQDNDLIIGGSADLSSSCKTYLKDLGDFDVNCYKGRNIHFGIREHAMGAILNGMALSGLRPFGSTFLVFSDYLRPAIRMSAMMNLPVIYIFSHDSITVGEDGMTHQPIEQLLSLEIIPNLYVYRPFDVNELLSSYRDILYNKHPSVLILPRDNQRISDLTKNNKIEEGAYILKHEETDNFITLLANGEELGLVIDVSEHLNSIGYDTRIVSMPCQKNFQKKNDFSLFPKNKTVAITFGVSEYYYHFTNKVIGMSNFGVSGKKEDVLKHFEYDVITLSEKIIELVSDENE